jgi:O-antigen ligase
MLKKTWISSLFKAFLSFVKDFKEYFVVLPLVGAVSFNLAYHFAQNFGYYVGFYVNYLDPIIHITDIAVLMAFIGLFALVGVKRLFNWKLDKFLLFFIVGFVLLQIIVSPTLLTFYFLFRICVYICFSWFMIRSLHKGLLDKDKAYKALFWAIVIAGLLQSGIGILQFTNRRMLGVHFLGESIINVGGFNTSSVYLSAGYFLRAYGTFPHPNVLSGFLCVVLVLLFERMDCVFNENFIKSEDGFNEKFIKTTISRIWPFLIFSLTISAGILVTWSRVGWITMFFLWVFWIGRWFRMSSLKHFKYYLAALATFFIIFLLAVLHLDIPILTSLKERLINQSFTSNDSWQQRIDLAKKAIKFWLEQPILGIGLGNYLIRLSNDPVYLPSGIRLIQPAHNIFLMILTETGIIGTLMFSSLAVIFLRRIKLLEEINNGVVVSILVLILLAGNLDHYFVTLPQGLLILIVIIPLVIFIAKR